MTIITQGFLGPLLITQGYQSSGVVALLITQSLQAVELSPAPSPDAWTIDPERTIQLT